MAVLALALVAGEVVESVRRPSPTLTIGFDLLPGYVAGTLVREGRYRDLYHPAAVEATERRVMAEARLAGDPRFGVWVNPPFFAWPFVPLAALPYRTALSVYACANVVLLAIAITLLCRLLPAGGGWRTRGLVPLLVFGSAPFWQVMTHQQSSFLSLALLSAAVTLWRRGRPAVAYPTRPIAARNSVPYGLTAGLVGGLLLFKPQLAVAVALVLIALGGRRVLAGLTATGLALLAVSEWTMPGSFISFVRDMPPIVRHLQNDFAYNWCRQVTLHSFWRLLVQGSARGETTLAVKLLWAASWLPLAAALALAVRRARRGDAADREAALAAAVVCMPLLMPYYMDYDLMLLAVPAVLFAARLLREPGRPLGRTDRATVAAWVGVYVATILTPFLTPQIHVHLTVVALLPLAGLSLARCLRPAAEPVTMPRDDRGRLAAAA
jgi:hypothetical protein